MSPHGAIELQLRLASEHKVSTYEATWNPVTNPRTSQAARCISARGHRNYNGGRSSPISCPPLSESKAHDLNDIRAWDSVAEFNPTECYLFIFLAFNIMYYTLGNIYDITQVTTNTVMV